MEEIRGGIKDLLFSSYSDHSDEFLDDSLDQWVSDLTGNVFLVLPRAPRLVWICGLASWRVGVAGVGSLPAGVFFMGVLPPLIFALREGLLLPTWMLEFFFLSFLSEEFLLTFLVRVDGQVIFGFFRADQWLEVWIFRMCRRVFFTPTFIDKDHQGTMKVTIWFIQP